MKNPTPSSEHSLEEIEILKLENISLKQEMLMRQKQQLDAEFVQFEQAIRERLSVPEDKEIGFSRDMKSIKVQSKGESDGKSRTL